MQVTLNRDGQQMGPYTVEQINEYLAQGSLLPTDYAWHEGLPEWIPVTEISGVGSAAAPPPFNPAQAPAVATGGNAKKKKLLLIGGIVGGVALIAALALVLLKGSNKETDAKVANSEKGIIKANTTSPLKIDNDLTPPQSETNATPPPSAPKVDAPEQPQQPTNTHWLETKCKFSIGSFGEDTQSIKFVNPSNNQISISITINKNNEIEFENILITKELLVSEGDAKRQLMKIDLRPSVALKLISSLEEVSNEIKKFQKLNELGGFEGGGKFKEFRHEEGEGFTKKTQIYQIFYGLFKSGSPELGPVADIRLFNGSSGRSANEEYLDHETNFRLKLRRLDYPFNEFVKDVMYLNSRNEAFRDKCIRIKNLSSE